MQVSGIDHVNILAKDLEETARFYEELLGLRRSDSSAAAMGFRGAWMRDGNGDALVHLVWKDPDADQFAGYEPGRSTNALHHVAFRCSGFEATREKLKAMQINCRVSDRRSGAVRQIFLTDPNGVNLELNFAGD